MPQQPSTLDHRLVVVTGKGGVGKTTVAAALALLGARGGRRTIAAELSGQRRIPALLGHPTAGAPGVEEELSPGLWATTLDPEGALAEWAGRLVRPRALVEVAVRSRAFAGFVQAAPGARELVSITKAWELGERERWLRERRAFDLVVLDAPASGHGLGLLRTPATFAEIARVGPIASQARLVADLLRDPQRCALVLVATAEETPVNETLELQARLEEQLGRGPSLIVLNGLMRDRLSARETETVRGAGTAVAAPVGRALESRRTRAELQATQLRRLRRGARAPVVTLPLLTEHALGPDELGVLAAELGRRL
ncbi:MAG: ArsA-related P-loop ATPase [Syntrophomonadaceae bacterium]